MKSFFLYLFVLSAGTFGILNDGHACPEEASVVKITAEKGIYSVLLDNGHAFELIGKKHPLLPIVRQSFEQGHKICITNRVDNLPTQIVARFNGFAPAAPSGSDCVKKGYVRNVYVNANYDWFYLEDGFSIRVIHRSKLTPQLYEAAFSKREVCITEMNLDATDGSWGIPREMKTLF